jgi:peptidyl-prolyl cis-trans isomerase C
MLQNCSTRVINRRSTQIAAVILCCGIGACSGRSHDSASSPVVALVNERPITAEQINQAMRLEPAASAPQAVDSLVNAELLAQGAVKQHIDSDPAVVEALDSARRQVLARLFAERNLYPKQAISIADLQEFYAANPILFKDRKRFQIKKYSFNGVEFDQQFRAQLDSVHSDSDLRNLLDKRDIKYTVETETMSPDQLPLDKLPDFEHASVGDVMIAEQDGSNVLLMSITGIQDDNAMSFDRAKPYIEAYLSNSRNREAVSRYLNQVKATAKISYPRAPGELRRDPNKISAPTYGFSAAYNANGFAQ